MNQITVCEHIPISKGDRLITIHAGGKKGFIPNALKTWKASTCSGDYHDNVNQEMFMKWLTEKLVPNLEPRSVLVILRTTMCKLTRPVLLKLQNRT